MSTEFIPQCGVVLFVKDPRRVSAFYQKTLDLQQIESDASHDLLRGHGYEVVIHAIPSAVAARIGIVEPPVRRENAAIKPTFVVADLEAVRRAAKLTGGGLTPAGKAWHFRGCTVLDGWDPEGNVVQFKQRDS